VKLRPHYLTCYQASRLLPLVGDLSTKVEGIYGTEVPSAPMLTHMRISSVMEEKVSVKEAKALKPKPESNDSGSDFDWSHSSSFSDDEAFSDDERRLDEIIAREFGEEFAVLPKKVIPKAEALVTKTIVLVAHESHVPEVSQPDFSRRPHGRLAISKMLGIGGFVAKTSRFGKLKKRTGFQALTANILWAVFSQLCKDWDESLARHCWRYIHRLRWNRVNVRRLGLHALTCSRRPFKGERIERQEFGTRALLGRGKRPRDPPERV